jgi:hypothetical protein
MVLVAMVVASECAGPLPYAVAVGGTAPGFNNCQRQMEGVQVQQPGLPNRPSCALPSLVHEMSFDLQQQQSDHTAI